MLMGMAVPAEHLAGLEEHMADVELAERFGWRLQDIDEAPAHRTDWLLMLARTRDEVREEQRKAQQERG